ncbi:uncharacterized protein PV07_12584 [Cladophialophora immunda]
MAQKGHDISPSSAVGSTNGKRPGNSGGRACRRSRFRLWIEGIPRNIQEIIRLEGGNEYKEGRDTRRSYRGYRKVGHLHKHKYLQDYRAGDGEVEQVNLPTAGVAEWPIHRTPSDRDNQQDSEQDSERSQLWPGQWPGHRLDHTKW